MKRGAVVSTLGVILAGALVVATRSEGKMEKRYPFGHARR